MGFSDRTYARRPDFHLRGRVVLWIVGATVIGYFIQGVALGRGSLDLAPILGVVPERLIGRGWIWQLVTHALLHEPHSIWHLAFNMIFLYWLGMDVAEIYGVRKFLVLYLGGAAACALAHAGVGYATGRTAIPAIGASGAIMAVAVVAAFYFPTRTVSFMFLIPMPLWMLVTFYVGVDLYYPLAGLQEWISSAGHLGGALFGVLFYKLHLDLPETGPFFRRFLGLFRRPVPARGEIDRILEKISRQGMGDLTDRERETLRRASQDKS